MDPRKLWRSYKDGVGFKPGDVLKPKSDAPPTYTKTVDDTVIVVRQCTLIPHNYDVIGERPNPRSPADRFLNLEINGHNWQKVGRV